MRSGGRFAIALTSVLVVVLSGGAGAARATTVANPTTALQVVADGLGYTLQGRPNAVAGPLLLAAAGTIGADGGVALPEAGIGVPPPQPLPAASIGSGLGSASMTNGTQQFVPDGDWTGQLDPATGSMTLTAPFRLVFHMPISVNGLGSALVTCTARPVTPPVLSATTPYDPATGAVVLGDTTFATAVDGCVGGGTLGAAAAALATNVMAGQGVPSDTGNALRVPLTLAPAPQPYVAPAIASPEPVADVAAGAAAPAAAAPSAPVIEEHVEASRVASISAVQLIALPAKAACTSRRRLRITLHPRAGLRVTRLVVSVAGRRRTISGRGLKAPVDLTGLPRGRFTVTATATTSAGTLKLVRRYRTCA